MSDYKLDDWIEPYLSEDGNSYIIPNYKINRLKGIEDENEILKEAVEIIKNKDTCKHVYFASDKYNNFESAWYGIAEFADKTLEKIKALNNPKED